MILDPVEPVFGVDYLHPCALHVGELYVGPIGDEGENYPGCPECGCMLEVDFCSWCGAWWIVFGANDWDDTVRSATVTSSGDVTCCRCAQDEEDEGLGEEHFRWEDPYDDAAPSALPPDSLLTEKTEEARN